MILLFRAGITIVHLLLLLLKCLATRTTPVELLHGNETLLFYLHWHLFRGLIAMDLCAHIELHLHEIIGKSVLDSWHEMRKLIIPILLQRAVSLRIYRLKFSID